ncbi:MAG: AtpZ/AtpI family protein [Candidatus Marinimicrobia bacterium]|nr:AtpZ/AtpI family protein [Candidatus Neomarinimicrobiota bacterium]MCH7955531.1 AtpZ/AtpI family protein [Candidatus Neomarinimicrobiota bacterium]
MTKPGDKKETRFNNQNYSFGLQVAVSFAFYMLGGYWLDKKFSTLPLFLLIGILFASISFVYFMRKLYRQK